MIGLRRDSLLSRLEALQREVGTVRAARWKEALRRFEADAEAVRFHLAERAHRPMIVAVLGGTGAGKSTLVNRLLGREVSGTSFRRTFTSGPVAMVGSEADLPAKWLGVPHERADAPARGKAGVVTVVEGVDWNLPHQQPMAGQQTAPCILIDTPDLDGDQPLHHAQADRVFRWADAVIFLVSPEKYQMTELLPYYRLVKRYAIPAIYAMNKCESAEMLVDYAKQREAEIVYAMPRDDAAYEPPPEANLASLRTALLQLQWPDEAQRKRGAARRAADLAGRLADEGIEPMRRDRRRADALIASLKAMETPATGVDVNPITRQLRHRLRQRSVLYLMGPQRVLDRVRQTPILLARLPRTTWDWLIRGKSPHLEDPAMAQAEENVPDFPSLLSDQFTQLLSRIDDAVRSNEATGAWIEADEAGWGASKIDPAEAGDIASEELDQLKQWLSRRWNATPRDTRLLQSLIRKLPGGAKVLKWTETAPYLLTIIVAAHGAFFGHVDLAVLGGYSLIAWIMERMSNEVASRTRQANTRIEQRFADLAARQIRQTLAWINAQVPSAPAIQQLDRLAAELADAADDE